MPNLSETTRNSLDYALKSSAEPKYQISVLYFSLKIRDKKGQVLDIFGIKKFNAGVKGEKRNIIEKAALKIWKPLFFAPFLPLLF